MTTTAPVPNTTEALPSWRVVALAGPCIDVQFPPDPLPAFHCAGGVDVDVGGKRHVAWA